MTDTPSPAPPDTAADPDAALLRAQRRRYAADLLGRAGVSFDVQDIGVVAAILPLILADACAAIGNPDSLTGDRPGDHVIAPVFMAVSRHIQSIVEQINALAGDVEREIAALRSRDPD